MPSKIRLRKPFAPIVKSIAIVLHKIGITPNVATYLMLVCASLSVLTLFFTQNFLYFGLLIFTTGIMDGVDGAIARLTIQKLKDDNLPIPSGRNFGGFLDSTMDRISEAVIFLGLILQYDLIFNFLGANHEISIIVIFIIMVSSFMISYTRARIEIISVQEKKKFDSNIGVFGRSERLFFIFILSVITQYTSNIIFTWGMVIFAIGVFLTFVYRLFRYKQYLEED